MKTVRPHPALGVHLQHVQELQCPAEASEFVEFSECSRPCVLRGLASDWPFVQQGRFNSVTNTELRRRVGSRTCNVCFEPGTTLFGYEVPNGWDAESSSGSNSVPRLVNPGRLAMPLDRFLELCEHKRHCAGPSNRRVRVVNMPYDAEDVPTLSASSSSSPEKPVDVSMEMLQKLALYCVEDANDWPQDFVEQLCPHDPASEVAPEWMDRLKERRIWMSAGGPEGIGHVTAGFHWDHMQNIHVLLSGKKEVFLLPPMEAPALHATRFCPQAQWRLEASDGHPGAQVVLEPMKSQESSSDYAVVMVDQNFDTNVSRNPHLRELHELPSWTVLHPGDAVFIPAGWWHSIRTWCSSREERGVPVALSMNFWYEPTKLMAVALRAELLALQVMSCQRALAGIPQEHLDAFLQKLKERGCSIDPRAFAQHMPGKLPSIATTVYDCVD